MIGSLNDLPSLVKALFQPERPGFEARFTQGETLQGFVVKTLSPGSAIVRLRGLEMAANTQKALTEGQAIMVKVEQLKPQFIVSLLPFDTPSKEKTAALLRMYLPLAAPVGETLSDLTALVKDLPAAAWRGSGMEKLLEGIVKEARKPDGQNNIFQMLGLFHENELAAGRKGENLKKTLLLARHNIEKLMEKHPEQYREALKKVNDALANIELRQLVNSQENKEVKSWQFPYWNGEGLDTARLYVERDEKGNKRAKNDETVRLTLVMQMSRLGQLRTEVLFFKGRIEGTIYAQSDAAVMEIEKHVHEVEKSLSEAGFIANVNAEKASLEFITRQIEPDNALPPRASSTCRCDVKKDKEKEKEKPKKALALKYDKEKDRAPKVAAKGRGEVAKRILEVAREHNIPIREDADLLEVLSKLDLEEEIPPHLYRVVAEMLSFIYRINAGNHASRP